MGQASSGSSVLEAASALMVARKCGGLCNLANVVHHGVAVERDFEHIPSERKVNAMQSY